MSRRPYEFDNFVIADGSAAVLDLAVNRRSFPAAEKTPSAETAEVLENVRARLDLLLDGKKNDNLRLIRMILRELSPALLEQNALAVVSRFVADNFPRLGEKKALDFYFHPRTLAVVRPFWRKRPPPTVLPAASCCMRTKRWRRRIAGSAGSRAKPRFAAGKKSAGWKQC